MIKPPAIIDKRNNTLGDLDLYKDKVRGLIKEFYPNYSGRDIDELMEAPEKLWIQRMKDFTAEVLAKNLPSGLI